MLNMGRDTVPWLCLCTKEQVTKNMKLPMCHFEQDPRLDHVQKGTGKMMFHYVSHCFSVTLFETFWNCCNVLSPRSGEGMYIARRGGKLYLDRRRTACIGCLLAQAKGEPGRSRA